MGQPWRPTKRSTALRKVQLHWLLVCLQQVTRVKPSWLRARQRCTIFIIWPARRMVVVRLNSITVQKNGSDQTLTCSVTNDTTCNDTTHSFTVSPGDYLSIKIVTQAGSTAVQHSWAIKIAY